MGIKNNCISNYSGLELFFKAYYIFQTTFVEIVDIFFNKAVSGVSQYYHHHYRHHEILLQIKQLLSIDVDIH